MNMQATHTPTDDIGRHVAMKVIAFCAAYTDQSQNADTDRLIADACKAFGITGSELQSVYQMRDSL